MNNVRNLFLVLIGLVLLTIVYTTLNLPKPDTPVYQTVMVADQPINAISKVEVYNPPEWYVINYSNINVTFLYSMILVSATVLLATPLVLSRRRRYYLFRKFRDYYWQPYDHGLENPGTFTVTK